MMFVDLVTELLRFHTRSFPFVATCLTWVVFAVTASSSLARERPPKRFLRDTPVRIVVIGGSITAHPANFMKFMAKRCTNIEVVNYGKARLKAKALHKRLQQKVVSDKTLRTQLAAKDGWMVYLGGLNGIYLPKRTRSNIAKTFTLAHSIGLRIAAISLPPWGSLQDGRFFHYKGLFNMQATALVNDFLLNKSGKVPPEQRADIAIDIYDSPLRDKRAKRRRSAEIAPHFAKSRYRKRLRSKRALTRQARDVPRMFMKKRYRGRYHFHPNWRGHRVIAQTFCKQAPTNWGCDCKKIARSWPKKGRIYP